ncbi:MAG: undecaprenyl-diphosphate phosphatase [Magnetospiraceae bacterium]
MDHPSLLQIFVLAVVQGITEFLPISSSAHLVLTPVLFGWPDQGLAIDVAVHVGTLGAVLVYFRHDVIAMIGGFFALSKDPKNIQGQLALKVAAATLPVVIAGFALSHFVPGGIRDPRVIAWTTLIFGIALYAADRWGPTGGKTESLGWIGALVIGASQILALLPGTSRSGITMTTARLLGMDRDEAARFSMLLSIPTILGAGLLAVKDLLEADNAAITGDALLAAILAGITAWVAIAALMAWLKRAGFGPFVIYRVILGITLLVIFL